MHSAYRVTESYIPSPCLHNYRLWLLFIIPYRVIDSGNHVFLPYIVTDYGTYLRSFLKELQTLAIFSLALQSYRLWKILYARYSYILRYNLSLPCRVTDSGNHFFLSCIFTDYDTPIHSSPLELQTLAICFLQFRVTDSDKYPYTQPYRVTYFNYLTFTL